MTLEKSKSAKKKGGIYIGGISELEVALSVKHLSVMIKSGLALQEAVEVLVKNTSNPKLSDVWEKIAQEIKGGKTLSDSMENHKKHFSSIIISIISIGEQSGTLEKNLLFLAEYLKEKNELQRKIKGALMYPMIVFGLTAAEMMGMMFFILPKLDSFFSSFKDIPDLTKGIMNLSRFVRENTLVIILGVVIFVILFRLFLKTNLGKIIKDKLALNVPIIKTINKSNVLATFSRTMGILLESGLPLAKGLEISAKTINSRTYRRVLTEIYDKVTKGETVSSVMESYQKYFPPTFIKMIEVGEQTGSLEENMNYLYDFYSAEVKDMSNNLTTLLEPLLLIFVGAMIGLLALIIISPIYQLTGTINAR